VGFIDDDAKVFAGKKAVPNIFTPAGNEALRNEADTTRA
jgi:hypothetical protein